MDADRLMELDSALRGPDMALIELRRRLLATFHRDRRGCVLLNLADVGAILARRALHAQIDQNTKEWRSLRRERDAMRREERRQRQEFEQARGI